MGWFLNIILGKPLGASSTESTSQTKLQAQEEGGWKDENGQPVPDDAPVQTVLPEPESTEVASREKLDPYIDSSGNKIRPEAVITRLKPTLSDEIRHLEVWVSVKNESDFNIELTGLNFLGSSVDPGKFLSPGEVEEFRAYSGKTPQNSNYHTAQLQYKMTETGDFFQADHYVEFGFEQNEHGKFYLPEEARLTRPVRDI